jgi:hypothetical protein
MSGAALVIGVAVGAAARTAARGERAGEAGGHAVEFGHRQAQRVEQPREGGHARGHRLAGVDQRQHVELGLRIDDAARQKRVGQAVEVVAGHVLLGRQEAGEARLLERHGPGLGQVVGAAGAAVLAQDQARPVERADQHPGGLHARALGGLDLGGAPLLPERGGGEGGHQHHRQHGGEQGGAGLARLRSWDFVMTVLGAPTVGRTQSRVSVPESPSPGGRVMTRRTPSGMATTGPEGLLGLAATVGNWLAGTQLFSRK